MAGYRERRIEKYDVQRALHLHEQIGDALKAKAEAAELHLLTESPLTDTSIFLTEPKYIVAPTQPIYKSAELDQFRKSLLPGLKPDFETSSVGSYHDIHGGLSYGSLNYDNVPGFKLYKGRVTDSVHSSHLANYMALEELSKETGKPKTELVRTTWVKVLPELTFAEFMVDYAKGQWEGKYPFNGLFVGLASGLNERKLRALQEDPQQFVDWLKQQVEVARTYTGISSNLSLVEPGGWQILT